MAVSFWEAASDVEVQVQIPIRKDIEKSIIDKGLNITQIVGVPSVEIKGYKTFTFSNAKDYINRISGAKVNEVYIYWDIGYGSANRIYYTVDLEKESIYFYIDSYSHSGTYSYEVKNIGKDSVVFMTNGQQLPYSLSFLCMFFIVLPVSYLIQENKSQKNNSKS